MSLRLEQIDDYRWRIPQGYKAGMRVPGLIYADARAIANIEKDNAPEQVAHAAFLPGIVNYSLAMPDIHWGYGLPIGGVVATDPAEGGVVTPGGIGYDINCGVRLMRTDLSSGEVEPKLTALADMLYSHVPAGVGSTGAIRVSGKDQRQLLSKGARWAVEKGFGFADDIEYTEEEGCLAGSDPDSVSARAYERGKDQAGTLGSGNHFLEIQTIEEIYDDRAANVMGLYNGQVTVMIHSGSRGLGYQVCDDYAKSMIRSLAKYGIAVPDRQLACVPVNSPEGRAYLGAMRCAANYAWANRQCLMHLTREVFEKVFTSSAEKLGLFLVYDVAHNIGKMEPYERQGKKRMLLVHRKGATRAFGPGNQALPEKYRPIGQPVIIPGDMGRNSYVLVGTERAEQETFGSTCHGAGRLLSRKAAVNKYRPATVLQELQKRGVVIRAKGKLTISEEAPGAYKDVNEVVDIVHNAGISKKVARMRPLAVIKG